MAAIAVQICDEIVEWLGAQSWSQPIAPERTYDPDPDFVRHDVMSVYVLPAVESDIPEEDSTRSSEHIRYRCEVHLRQRYDAGDKVPMHWVDERIQLIEEIADAMRQQQLDIGIGRTAWIDQVIMSRIWDRASLIDDQTYVGVIEAVIDVWY